MPEQLDEKELADWRAGRNASAGDLNASEVLRLLQGRCSSVTHVNEPIEQDQQMTCLIPRQWVMSLGKALDRAGDRSRGSRAIPAFLPEAGRIHAGGDMPREGFDREVSSSPFTKNEISFHHTGGPAGGHHEFVD